MICSHFGQNIRSTVGRGIRENVRKEKQLMQSAFQNLMFVLVFVGMTLSGCGHTIDKKVLMDNVSTSDYEILGEERGTESDDALPQEAVMGGRRPAEGTAARMFYDRLVYIMGNLRETEYVHHRQRIMKEDEGIYKYDCSGFAGDFILKQVLPQHYEDLARNAKRFHSGKDDEHPRAWGFYDYFNEILSGRDESGNAYWYVFKSIEKIQPGDIIVVKYDEKWQASMIEKCKSASTGHVMIAWSPPVRTSKEEFSICVVDSASSGHGKDTRRAGHRKCKDSGFLSCRCCPEDIITGIGKGKMWYGVNREDNRPVYYRWRNSDGCKYTLTGMKTDCDGNDGFCCTRNCKYPRKYYERLQGIIMARPLLVK